jgi:hypothetical protein
MGLLHLAQYAVQPVILLLFLLAPVLLAADVIHDLPDLRVVPLIGLIPPVIIAIGQRELYSDWRRHLLFFPVQFMAAVAIGLSNSVAVFRGLLAQQEQEFRRTPKFSLSRHNAIWRRSRYRVAFDGLTLVELLFAGYALVGLIIALGTSPAFAPYMLTYALSFALFAGWNIYQTAS